jgi:beta-glucanase (GH16 family)
LIVKLPGNTGSFILAKAIYYMLRFKIKSLLAVILLSISILSCSKSSQNNSKPYVYTPLPPPIDSNWSFETTPVWADEFTNTGTPDTTKWKYDLGGGGWGNAESEDYTNSLDNASVANNVLTITAKKQSLGGEAFTSSRMISKFSMTYGRIEIKAMLPSGKGTWPAIWMLPDTYAYGAWPASGEVDIMEMVGYDPNNVHFSAHNSTYFAGNAKTSTMNIPTASTAYHLYREDWTPYAIRGYYDNNLVFTYVNDGKGSTTWPYDQKFHLLMNIAVGGSWGGIDGIDTAAFPTSMKVEYIHFFNIIHKT